MLRFIPCSPAELPMTLLLEADPNEQAVSAYLKDSYGFSAILQEQTVGVCVVKPDALSGAELMNIAVDPAHQAKGIGHGLLAFVIEQLRAKGFTRLELGTGTFGYQLTFYQRHGFRVVEVVKDHFVEHYPEPIFEDGIQHQDQLILSLDL
ncbi:GNAT family N-acetyltransferase [Marinobacter hydrocarbonoclasticus]|nr:GNAT family N-acetyltransferase [Marinobacter nauticus]